MPVAIVPVITWDWIDVPRAPVAARHARNRGSLGVSWKAVVRWLMISREEAVAAPTWRRSFMYRRSRRYDRQQRQDDGNRHKHWARHKHSEHVLIRLMRIVYTASRSKQLGHYEIQFRTQRVKYGRRGADWQLRNLPCTLGDAERMSVEGVRRGKARRHLKGRQLIATPQTGVMVMGQLWAVRIALL